jgi:hypothetical protein
LSGQEGDGFDEDRGAMACCDSDNQPGLGFHGVQLSWLFVVRGLAFDVWYSVSHPLLGGVNRRYLRLGLPKNISTKGSAEPQIPPRHAPRHAGAGGMTKERVTVESRVVAGPRRFSKSQFILRAGSVFPRKAGGTAERESDALANEGHPSCSL